MTDLLVDLYAANGVDFHSENVDIVGYDRASKTLYIEFQSSGDVYSYTGVEESTYNLLVTAPSVGRFVNTYIKGNGYDGAKFDAYTYITLRDSSDAVYANGSKVVVDYPDAPDWNGVGVVEDDQPGAHNVTCVRMQTGDSAGCLGGFSASALSPFEDDDDPIQPERKWLTTDSDQSPFGPSDEADDFLASLLAPTRYAVEYTVERPGVPVSTFKPEFKAVSEADVLCQFNEAVSSLENLLGWTDMTIKIRSVTHYFD